MKAAEGRAAPGLPAPAPGRSARTSGAQIQAEAFTASMRDGVLRIEWLAGTSVDDEDAASVIGRADAISEDVCPPMLVVLNGMVILTRNALLRFARELNVAAMAIVGPSAVDRTIADFFVEVHEPPYPTRYFQQQEDALTWLTNRPFAR